MGLGRCQASKTEFVKLKYSVWFTFSLGQCGPTTGLRAACGPIQRFQWPAETFRKILKSETCWKACEVTFVSLYYFRWIKWICTRTIPFCAPFCLFIYFTIKIKDAACSNPPLWHLSWWPLFTRCPAVRCLEDNIVVLKRTSGEMNSVLPNKSFYLSAKRGLHQVALEPNYLPIYEIGFD